MVFLELRGGLGNQLFQYATARSISLTSGQELLVFKNRVRFDWQRKEYISRIINYPLRFERSIRRFIPNSIRITEANFVTYLNSRNNQHIIIQGYWQSEIYFLENAEIIRSEINLRKNIKGNSSLLNKILNTNSVAIHIRRGDYVNQGSTKSIFGDICTIGYYTHAINYFKEKIENPEFYVFSDNPEWCRKTFTKDLFNARIYIIDSGHKSLSTKFDNCYLIRNLFGLLKYLIPDKTLEDFSLMANCKHFIIANSTYSWWAAWLSGNKEKIICTPEKWDNLDREQWIIPESWIKISG